VVSMTDPYCRILIFLDRLTITAYCYYLLSVCSLFGQLALEGVTLYLNQLMEMCANYVITPHKALV
jgi:hypothetical protein